MSEPETFAGLKFLIQYRRKDDGVRWHNMAGFDVAGPAEKYHAEQRTDAGWPWEYRLVDLSQQTPAQADWSYSSQPGKLGGPSVKD